MREHGAVRRIMNGKVHARERRDRNFTEPRSVRSHSARPTACSSVTACSECASGWSRGFSLPFVYSARRTRSLHSTLRPCAFLGRGTPPQRRLGQRNRIGRRKRFGKRLIQQGVHGDEGWPTLRRRPFRRVRCFGFHGCFHGVSPRTPVREHYSRIMFWGRGCFQRGCG
jgi:hypothetical protein